MAMSEGDDGDVRGGDGEEIIPTKNYTVCFGVKLFGLTRAITLFQIVTHTFFWLLLMFILATGAIYCDNHPGKLINICNHLVFPSIYFNVLFFFYSFLCTCIHIYCGIQLVDRFYSITDNEARIKLWPWVWYAFLSLLTWFVEVAPVVIYVGITQASWIFILLTVVHILSGIGVCLYFKIKGH